MVVRPQTEGLWLGRNPKCCYRPEMLGSSSLLGSNGENREGQNFTSERRRRKGRRHSQHQYQYKHIPLSIVQHTLLTIARHRPIVFSGWYPPQLWQLYEVSANSQWCSSGCIRISKVFFSNVNIIRKPIGYWYSEIVMQGFGSEPRFEPEPLEPKSRFGSKFRVFAEPNLRSSSRFSQS